MLLLSQEQPRLLVFGIFLLSFLALLRRLVGLAGLWAASEQLLAEGEDGDEAGDLVNLHPVVAGLAAEGGVEDLGGRH